MATKLGICIHLNAVLDKVKGIFDLTLFLVIKGAGGGSTTKKFFILFFGSLNQTCMVLNELKEIFDMTSFRVKNFKRM